MHEIIKNQNFNQKLALPYTLDHSAINFHSSIKNYTPSQVLNLEALAKNLNVNSIFVKDESKRFTLDTFKALGPIFALYRFYDKLNTKKYSRSLRYSDFFDSDYLKQFGDYVFTTATDGNHGKALAWACQLIDQKSVIYIPNYTVQARMEAIKKYTKNLIKVNGSYQETVNFCYQEAEKNKRIIITDSSSEKSYESAKIIMEAYLTLFYELEKQITKKIDFVFLQCGVGSLTASGLYYYIYRNGNCPKIINVEPFKSDCVYQSIKHEQMTKANGSMKTIMAGLNCDIPSYLAWQLLKNHLEFTMLIEEDSAKKAIRQYYMPLENDPKIISAESGAASLAAVQEVLTNEESRQMLGIKKNSNILIINTEANTDPENIERILNEK